VLKKVWSSIKGYRPDKLEAIGIVGSIVSALGYLWWYDFNWRAFILAAAALIFGAMSGYMLHDVWMPPRRRSTKDRCQ
jgi:hypothetical protein